MAIERPFYRGARLRPTAPRGEALDRRWHEGPRGRTIDAAPEAASPEGGPPAALEDVVREEVAMMKLPAVSRRTVLTVLSLVLVSALRPLAAGAEEPKRPTLDRAHLIEAAREVMAAQTYCALITIDETGRPQARTMNPFPPEEDMAVWMATNPSTRKAEQIRKDPRVQLYYADHKTAIGYVTLTGRAELVSDMKEILKRKRAYWDDGKGGGAFPGLKNIVLIKVVPERLEVLNYGKGATAAEVTWRAPSVELGSGAGNGSGEAKDTAEGPAKP